MDNQALVSKYKLPSTCCICGASEYKLMEVLWDELVEEWELTKIEEEYVNIQQGYYCPTCGSNLRAATLGKQILQHYKIDQTFDEFSNSEFFNSLSILEIGDAGALKSFIDITRGYYFKEFIQPGKLKAPSNTFDLIIHSDVLEHVENPISGLSECFRVLKKGGAMFLTIPIIVDKPTRSRKGLEKSYHLPNAEENEGQLVQYEFGNDFWKLLFQAGFQKLELFAISYPCSIGIKGIK